MQKEQEKVKEIFKDVANNYDEIEFFKISAKHVAELTEKHTRMRPSHILDVACGTGNVVLECASRMPKSTFDAIDISEGMLDKAKNNARKNNIDNIEFHVQDVSKLDLTKKYHVITCAYALFFLPDAPRVLEKLVSLLRPMGIVVFSTFTDQAFSPSSDILLPLLDKYGSKSAKEYDVDSWKNLKSKKDIERLCTLSYVMDMHIEEKEIRYGLSIDGWWELMNNTGFKGMLMELSVADYESVKSEYYTQMLKHADMDGEVELIADSYFVSVS